MENEKKETPQIDLNEVLKAAGIRKCVLVAWVEDGSMRQIVTGMSQMELVGFAELLKADAMGVRGINIEGEAK